MSTRDKLLKEQERELEIMQGASVKTVIAGREYTWLEPSARDRRLMLGEAAGIGIGMREKTSQPRAVAQMVNWMIDWHPELAQDEKKLDALLFGGGDTQATIQTATEIANAFKAVVEMLNRPFREKTAPHETLTPMQ